MPVVQPSSSNPNSMGDGSLETQACSLCQKEEPTRKDFKEVAQDLRLEYIFQEYESLADAWKIYHGLALYREYRGIGGSTQNLETEPKPCMLCLIKLVNLAQAIYQLTSTVEAGQQICKTSKPEKPRERWSTSPSKRVAQTNSDTGIHTSPSKRVAQTNGDTGIQTSPGKRVAQTNGDTSIQGRSQRSDPPPARGRIKNGPADTNGRQPTTPSAKTAAAAPPRTPTAPPSRIQSAPPARAPGSSRTSPGKGPARALPAQPETAKVSSKNDRVVIALPEKQGAEARGLVTVTAGRSRRSLGRSLTDRHPDFEVEEPVAAHSPPQTVSEAGKSTQRLGGHSEVQMSQQSSRQLGLQQAVLSPSSHHQRVSVAALPRGRPPSLVAARQLGEEDANRQEVSDRRPRRSLGRSLSERNPDFVDVPKIPVPDPINPDTVIEKNNNSSGIVSAGPTTSGKRKTPTLETATPVGIAAAVPTKRIRTPTVKLIESLSSVVDSSPERVNSVNSTPVAAAKRGRPPKSSTTAVIPVSPSSLADGGEERALETWQTDYFRSVQLGRLDEALNSAGWSQAIRSGKNMEREVFKNASSQAEYVAGITRLVSHFSRSSTNTNSSPTEQGTKKSVILGRPTKKPANQLERRSLPLLNKTITKKVVAPSGLARARVNCPICGLLTARLELAQHVKTSHKGEVGVAGSHQQTAPLTQPPSALLVAPTAPLAAPTAPFVVPAAPLTVPTVPLASSSAPLVVSSTNSGVSLPRQDTTFKVWKKPQRHYIVKTSRTGRKGKRYLEPHEAVDDLEAQIQPKEIKPRQTTPERLPSRHAAVIKTTKTRESTEGLTTAGDKAARPAVAAAVALGGVRSPTAIVSSVIPGRPSHSSASPEKTYGLKIVHHNFQSGFGIIDNGSSVRKAVLPEKVFDELVDSSSENEVVKASIQEEEKKKRPQRRTRSIEDRHPDFVVDAPSLAKRPASAQTTRMREQQAGKARMTLGSKEDVIVVAHDAPEEDARVKQTQELESSIEEDEGEPRLAKDWFEINKE